MNFILFYFIYIMLWRLWMKIKWVCERQHVFIYALENIKDDKMIQGKNNRRRANVDA